uniref:DNA-binding transcriptional response regulator, NtrC family, contains REC, AAA-type ATPase, and a Fis-type DNA-binding domains n=1 Tax=Candidatus Kentrum sp. SD TaxID=2126332 RepID=A0A450Y8H9_9GAMM|nr:MAG: DNA-binding transcriptional response regulator, NtrC family, contains REC, AAA-type ATPase, and a Fis-type DNA-binding domains [Candidatus Kentron sp. SD]VFK42484.1 MAG: DNA-binding transcriptional response regulator, NtrC family, contains REC, AAA-type ATPase, and a Fis-type DNA-binding domains [Candidatus Kentron sp. SD]VFK78149.1 MAG: DNA-binding transcriptional response regulator, NtrC family, contains REC, AAA-type ATPase, and a Fis-type DNA-binding domains [Candidatus Kentron sp. SD
MRKLSTVKINDAPTSPPSAEIITILDGYSEPSILMDDDYRILAANRAYRNRYAGGRNPCQQHCHAVSHDSAVPCDQAGEQCPLQGSKVTGELQRILHVHHTPNGTEHVEVETRPIRNEVGRILYYLEILRRIGVAGADSKTREPVGNSQAFNRMRELARRVAPSDVSVLLLGESGVGKELIAQEIHKASKRARRSFIPVECSGLTESLFENELFGHEKGAFTGAYTQKIGLVEAAHGGTLLLDEIGDIPLPIQVKLLRLIETGAYRRVGGVDLEHTNFRLICATHQNLDAMVKEGAFRQDLYYRINAFPIRLPALRERREDLPLLVDILLREIAGSRKLSLHPKTMSLLTDYDFPGNVRELRNILERATLLTDGGTILPDHLPEACRIPLGLAQSFNEIPGGDEDDLRDILPLDVVEERYLRWILRKHPNAKKEIAQKLGISERTLYRKARYFKGYA